VRKDSVFHLQSYNLKTGLVLKLCEIKKPVPLQTEQVHLKYFENKF